MSGKARAPGQGTPPAAKETEMRKVPIALLDLAVVFGGLNVAGLPLVAAKDGRSAAVRHLSDCKNPNGDRPLAT
jgi:hypothetical protein